MTLLRSAIELATLLALGLVAYHHVGYPLLLKFLRRPCGTPQAPADLRLPSMTIVMPAYQEASQIAAKLRNMAKLDYPADLLRVVVACDGCTDATAEIARATLTEPDCVHLNVAVVEHRDNRGKVAVLNETIAGVTTDVVVLSDVSAMLPQDALIRAAVHFHDPKLGAVGGTYRLMTASSAGESTYWKVQLAVKRGEAALGAPLGLHGAFYAFRRAAWVKLPRDTINDDFIMPMQIFLRGWRVAYDDEIVALEADHDDAASEMRRRRRIAAGNAQQLVRLLPLLHPRHGGVAFAFASGKALRVIMPFLIAFGVLGSLICADGSTVFTVLAVLQVLGLLAAAAGGLLRERAPKPLAVAHYLVAGHLASVVGLWRYLSGKSRRPWQRASITPISTFMHLPASVAVAKRILDVLLAAIALMLSAPLWPVLALAIKLDSPGHVLSRQLRVGRAMPDRTELFGMLKFRTIAREAEAGGGPVLLVKDDPRVTRVGRLLRKTRLDEIPQLINVLWGEMSMIGPRPERPGFHSQLEEAIPFFADRTVGLRPGITGLAQVNPGIRTGIDLVRRKVTFDHVYAMRLSTLRSWLISDIRILVRTITVVALGRGD